MRVAIGFVLLILSFVSASYAQGYSGGSILIFSDAALTNPTLADNQPGMKNLYVVNTDFIASTGLRFRTVAGVGFTGVWLSESSPFITVGKSTKDLSIGFGSCLFAPVMVLTMTYQFFGTSAACSALSIAPPDGFPFALCNSGGGCIDELPCLGLGSLGVNCPVATESTTWGRVKALYRD